MESLKSFKDKKIVLLALTPNSLAQAKKLKARFKNALLYPAEKLKSGGLRLLVKKTFKNCDALIFFSATGIAVRVVAPLLGAKNLDPAVVVVDDMARFSISLVSGHLGGANALANEVAVILGAVPVITTATDSRFLPCVEDIAAKTSSVIEDVKKIKVINSAILNGSAIFIIDGNRKRLSALKKTLGYGKGKGLFCFAKKLPARPSGSAVFVVITSSADYPVSRPLKPRTLMLRPREFSVGIGCKKGVSVKEVERAVKAAFRANKLSTLSIRNFATIDIKKTEQGILDYATKARLSIEFYGVAELNTKKPPSGVSQAALKNTGAFAVAEPAALLSSGAKRLWFKKIRTRNITLAAAKASFR